MALIIFLLFGCSAPVIPTTVPTTQPHSILTSYIQNLTVEQKVGQLFLARCCAQDAIADIERYHLGGFVLFDPDIQNETPSSLMQTIHRYQNAADIPMLIAVDEEGGSVTRVSRHPAFRASHFSSPRMLYQSGGMDAIQATEVEKSQLLSSLGINVNLSPVCDITTDINAFMYRRSLGQSPEITAQYVCTVLDTMSQNQVAGVLKHFPGYGNNTDTHTGIAVDNRSLSQLESWDLVPFQAGIDAGCGAIMVSHIYVNALDPDLPATLSPAVNRYLRQNMGFDGVVLTDDLVMQAITDEFGVEESAVLAILAGNDLLCSTQYRQQYDAVLTAVKDGRISMKRLDEAVSRVIQWKIQMGILRIA